MILSILIVLSVFGATYTIPKTELDEQKIFYGTGIAFQYPGEIDYWAGAKAVFLSQRGLKKGGITSLVGEFAEGIASTHKQRGILSLKSVSGLKKFLPKLESLFFFSIISKNCSFIYPSFRRSIIKLIPA